MHLVANRIGFDKKTVTDSNSYKRVAIFCRKMELKYNLQQVLSPKQFLSKEQRLLPRNDERKKQLSLLIRRTLYNAKDFDHFVRAMQSKGYKVIKGRGISFIDDKKVNIKGSEVGYSLQKIEQDLNFQHRLKTDRAFFKETIERKPLKETEAIAHAPIKDENSPVTNQLKQDISETVDTLLKPKQINEQIEPKLLVKKKEKKKKRNLHL